MRDLSLNILDIAENSVKAKADRIWIDVCTAGGLLTLRIADNGCGMPEEFLAKATDPFVTTRTTRKVGLGLPLLKMLAEQSGGDFSLSSEVGKGTTVEATFRVNHIDRLPLGDISATMRTLVAQAPETNFVLNYSIDSRAYTFDTNEIKDAIGDIDISEPKILVFITDMIKENIENINGGHKL